MPAFCATTRLASKSAIATPIESLSMPARVSVSASVLFLAAVPGASRPIAFKVFAVSRDPRVIPAPHHKPPHGSPKTCAVTANGRLPKNADCENYLGLSQSFFRRSNWVEYFEAPKLFRNISMIDIDEILADAIRTAWLEISGPELRSPHRIEVQTARRVRHALERGGIIITPSRPMPKAAAPKEAEGTQHAHHS